jgi:hypothetical protein
VPNHTRVLWITQSAVFTALLVVVQMATAAFGNQLITGAIVNLLLIVSVMTCGLPVGCAVGLLSPVGAKLFNIGPLWSLIPFIMLGNLTLILIWHGLGHKEPIAKIPATLIALPLAACAKALVLFLGIAQLAVPILLRLPEPQASVISNTFSVSQLFTASIGGAVALVVLPLVRRAVTRG